MNKRSGWAAIIVGILTATLPTFLLCQAVTFLFAVPLVLGLLCVLLGVTALRKEGKYARHIGWIAVALTLIAIILPFGMIAYHNRSGPPVEIVVPSGFKGPIWIVEDPQAGGVIPKVEGKYRVNIPKSGVIRVRTTDMFAKWHSETWRYSDGKLILSANVNELSDNSIALRDGGYVAMTRNGREVRLLAYYVGTRKDGKQFLETPSDPPE